MTPATARADRRRARARPAPGPPALLALLLAVVLVSSRPAAAAVVTVDDCVQRALARAPSARAAAAQAQAAGAQVDAAAAAYYPKLLAQAGYGRSEGFDQAVTNGGETSLGLTVALPLLDGGLRKAELAAARARLRSAEAITRQRRADVAFAVRSAYFTALAARREAEIQRDAGATLRAAVALLDRQEAQGLVVHDEVLRAKLALRTADDAARTAQATLEQALHDLEALTATPVATDTLAEPVESGVEPYRDEQIDASPLLLDSRAALEAAQRDADAVRSERRSHLDLTATGGFLGVRPEPTFRDDGGGQFLVGFSLPIFDGGAIAGRIAAADAAASAAQANLDETRQTVRMALSRVQIEGQRARQEMSSWEQGVPQAEETFQLTRARYFGGGNVRLLEVLDALTQLVDARLALARARLAARIASATQQSLLGVATP
jgi:outer membrane protein TolC